MEGKQEACPMCNKTFLKDSMETHMLTHTGENSFRHKESFTKHCSLLRRIKVHKGEKRFEYSLSPESSLRSLLLGHKTNVTAEKAFECSQCHKTFSKRCNLVQHMTVHTGERPYECPQCQKGFSQRSSLVQHLIIHTGEKPYGCSHCQKTFSRKSTLEQHLIIHTGEKPYACSQCQETFSQRSILAQHMTIHTGEKPHQCSQCQKTFSRRSSLVQHMTIHTGEKPYECSECLKPFSRKSSLGQHMKLHKEIHSRRGIRYKAGQTCQTSSRGSAECDKITSSQQTPEDHLISDSTVEKSDSPEEVKLEADGAESIICTVDCYPELVNFISESDIKAEVDDMDVVKEEY